MILKAWKKREKVIKHLNIIYDIVLKNLDNTILILKVLIMMHNYFKKGPPEIFTVKI